ncbi:hypothetical protein C8Q73DRAFT_754153 [Cubamyces lactineus]|nr:hypothetical protein C8Q73DRAFT_754153 [Cubamyces lactineus]
MQIELARPRLQVLNAETTQGQPSPRVLLKCRMAAMAPSNDTIYPFNMSPNARPAKATSGPILIQGFLQYFCQGVIISQGMKFYNRWADDPIALRAYVVILLLFSLLQTVLESYKTWVETIDAKHWWVSHLHATEFICNAVICSLCEAFLVRRCYRITQKNLVILVLLYALLMTTLGASIYLANRTHSTSHRGYVRKRPCRRSSPQPPRYQLYPLHASAFAYPIWVFGTLAMALSLTSILSVSLWRTRTGLRHLDRTLTHIIFITFESAALPTACMLASAIVYSIRATRAARAAATEADLNRDTTAAMLAQTLHLDLFFAILTGKVYTLGILRTLNSRSQFRAGMHTSNLGRRSLTGWGQGENQADGAECPGGHTEAGRGRGEEVGCGASRMRQGDACGGDDRFSGETMRAPDPGLTEFGVARTSSCLGVGMQKSPSTHGMTPKVRKSASRNSGQSSEYARQWDSPP